MKSYDIEDKKNTQAKLFFYNNCK